MHIIANSTINLNTISGNSSNKQHTSHTKNPARANTMVPERSASISLPLQKNSPEKNLDEVLSTLKITSTSTLTASSQQQQQQQQQKLDQNQQKSPLSHCPSISHMSSTHSANGRVEGTGKKFSTEKLSLQDNNEDEDCQELDYYSEAGEDSYQLSYNGSGDFSDSDSDFLPVTMDDEEDDDDEEYERASYDDDDEEEEYEPASYEDDYDCDVSVMSAEQEDDPYDDIAETPFWYSFEEYDQVQSIFRAYEKEVIRTEQGIRSVRPFIARIKRTNVSLTQAFQTLDEVQICNHQRIDPRKCFPLVKELILLTTWDPEEGLPQKFQILDESHILDFWKARVKGYPSYLYCFPTLDCSESFLYEVSAEDQPITYSDQGLRDPILQYLPPKEWDLFPLDDNGDGEGEASCLRG